MVPAGFINPGQKKDAAVLGKTVNLESYLASLQYLGMKPGLGRIRALLGRCGNPQEKLTCVHVAGTNGKGSVCALVESILRAAGFRTGLYTSPHLVSYRERIRVCGELIGEGMMNEIAGELIPEAESIRETSEEIPTYFEFLSALAFVYFAREKVEYAVLETGLGGRLDATNVVDAPVAAITTVDFDHQELLGYQLASIAAEKAAIIKEGANVVCGILEKPALEVIQRRCEVKRATLIRIGDDIIWDVVAQSPEGSTVCFKSPSGSYSNVFLPLAGRYQIENCAVAIGVIEALRGYGTDIAPGAVSRGIETTRWPGRLDIISHRPLMVVDCAHNVAGAKALAVALGDLFPGKRWAFVFGVLRDKNIVEMCDSLVPHASAVVATMVPHSRSLEAGEVAACCRGRTGVEIHTVPNLGDAISLARRIVERKEADGVLISGSGYLVGEVLKLLERLPG
jgi:dihydrofolate synthase/folylpolyglutamate synthase